MSIIYSVVERVKLEEESGERVSKYETIFTIDLSSLKISSSV